MLPRRAKPRDDVTPSADPENRDRRQDPQLSLMFKSGKDKNSKEKEGKEKATKDKDGKKYASQIEEKIFPRIKSNDPHLTGVRVKIIFPQIACKFFKLLKDNTKCLNVAAQQLTIDDDLGKEIGNCLQANKTINFLSFPECSIKGEALKEISKGLKLNKTLLALTIGPERVASGMNDAGIESILLSIIDNSTLTKLELLSLRLSNGIARPIAKVLTKNTLRALNLSRNPIGDEGYQVLVQAIPRVTSLRSLVLDHTLPSAGMTQQLLTSMRTENFQLIRLSLAGLPVSDSSTAFTGLSETLSYVKTLREVELSGCKLGAEGASVLFQLLATNIQVRRLDVSDNDIRDLSSLELEHSHVISDLNLAGNHLGDDALTLFAQQLPYNRSLHRLNLQRNDFSAERLRQLFTPELLEQTCLCMLLVGQPVKSMKDQKDVTMVGDSVTSALSYSVGSEKGNEDSQRLTEAAVQVLARTFSLQESKQKLHEERGKSVITWDHVSTWPPGIVDASSLQLGNRETETMLNTLQRTDPGQYSSTHTIRLFGNNLTALSSELIDSLPRGLTRLEAARNSIRSLATASFTALTRLAVLDVRANALEDIPDAIAAMPSLRQLLISQNQLSSLPRALMQRSDVELHISGNALPQRLLQDLRTAAFAAATLTVAGERDFAEMLLRHDAPEYLALRAVLLTLNANEHESTLLGMLPLIEFLGASQALIPVLLQAAVQASDRPSTCLRSDCPEIFLISKYMASISGGYLEKTVRPVVERILDAGKLPIVAEPTAGEECNLKETIGGLTTLLFDLLSKHLDLLPLPLQNIVTNCFTFIMGKWPTTARDAAQGLAVACTLFLRLITPALISPETFGIATAKQLESKSKRKNLLAVAKHLQTQASRAYEDNNRVRQFAADLFARPPAAAPSPPQAAVPKGRDLEQYAHDFVKHCQTNAPKIAEAAAAVSGSRVARMLHVLLSLTTPMPPIAMLSVASRKPRRGTTNAMSLASLNTPSGKTLQTWRADSIPQQPVGTPTTLSRPILSLKSNSAQNLNANIANSLGSARTESSHSSTKGT